MSMIPLGASSCACKTISWSTEQWRIFVKTWFYLCVHFCHGKYMKVHKTAIFYFTGSVMLHYSCIQIKLNCKGMEVVTLGSPSVVVCSENYSVLKCFLGWFISSFLWMVSQVPCPHCCPVLPVLCLCSDLNRVKGLW